MKFSTTLSLALAPLALAKSVRNKYPARARRDPSSLGAGAVAPIVLGAGGVQATEIILIWVNAGGAGAVTQTINEQVTVTQTVTVPAGGAPSIVADPAGATTVVNPGETAVIPGAAATHSVVVGGPQGLAFSPQEIKAAVGDVVVFEFLSQNHTVTQSTFDGPCDALPGGMDSGFMANPNNTVAPAPQVAMQVMTGEPLWMYCRQGNHCGRGMTFSINANAEKTHAQFQANAIAQRGQGLEQTAITGGAPAAAAPEAAPPAAAPPAADPNASATLGGAPTIASVDPLAPLATAPIVNGGAGGGIVMGQGVLQADGSCQCAVQCTAIEINAFPDPNQGLNAFGGVGGTIPMASAGVAPARR
jgi:plastocyanin